MSQIFSSEYFADIVLVLGGILIVNLIVRVIQYLISSKVKEKNLRYGLRSATSFFGYFLIFILLIGIFSNHLSKLAVVFGVAGAGIELYMYENLSASELLEILNIKNLKISESTTVTQ